MARRKQPGEDRPVAQGADLTVLTAIRAYKHEAEMAKRDRTALNRFNTNTYLGRQDWSHKQKGQSKEFLPKVPVAVEQFSAFVKRALVQFGEWFTMDMPPNAVLQAHEARDLVLCFLNRMPDGLQKWTSFPLVLSDGVKKGLLESLITLKIHGRKRTERQFFAERGIEFVSVGEEGQIRANETKSLKTREIQPWRLIIDLISAEDYFPDPTDRNLYEIHTVERDLSDLIEVAENDDIYDPDVLELIDQDFEKKYESWEKARSRNQTDATPPSFRKRVVVDEFWGDILDARGRVVKKNCVAAIANDRYLLRIPEDNPFWHQESPFVSSPLVRVPGSVWHKALFDHVAPLNVAINELFNLMLDGGLSSVWGIKQVRTGLLEDARQIAGGIPQGISLAIKDETPDGMKVVETVSEGKVPQDAIAMFQIANSEHLAASLSNELRMGMLPPKQVKATEVIEASQSSAVTLDAISADIETELIGPTLRKAWMTILQNADDLSSQDIVGSLGTRVALTLARMGPEERFANLAGGCGFRVHGLSATLARVRDFQKAAALMQMAVSNPILFQAFAKRFSGDKILTYMMKLLNINPSHLEQNPEELQNMPNRFKELMGLMQMTGGQGKGGMVPAEGELPAEINATINPLTQMSGQG